jgi:hypothetical protein
LPLLLSARGQVSDPSNDWRFIGCLQENLATLQGRRLASGEVPASVYLSAGERRVLSDRVCKGLAERDSCRLAFVVAGFLAVTGVPDLAGFQPK